MPNTTQHMCPELVLPRSFCRRHLLLLLLLQFTAPPAPQVTFTPFADQYGLAYDYDKIWITDTNNVLTGLSYSGTVSCAQYAACKPDY